MKLKAIASIMLAGLVMGCIGLDAQADQAAQVTQHHQAHQKHHGKKLGWHKKRSNVMACIDWNLDYFFEGADNAYTKGNYPKARSMYGCVLQITKKWPNYTPELSIASQRLARMEAKAGNYRKAETMLKDLIALDEREMGPYFRDVGVDAYLLGSLAHKQGRLGEAQQYYEQAITVFEKNVGPYDRDMISLLYSLAELYRQGDRNSEAEQLEGRARVMEAHDIDHPVLRI